LRHKTKKQHIINFLNKNAYEQNFTLFVYSLIGYGVW